MQALRQRWIKGWLLAFGAHFALSVGGFWLLSIVAFAIAESNFGPAPAWLAPLEKIVTFGLLQPLAYWVFAVGEIRYWTWPGLALSTLLIAINSAVAVAIVQAIVRGGRSRRSR
jgi:hypothetical protein